MRLASRALLLSALLLASPLVAAKGACLIQGQLSGMSFTDCSEVDAASPDGAYRMQCESNAASIKSVGGNATATVSGACPADPQGICENPMGRKVRTYYYGRNAQTLVVTQRSCESAGGTWRSP